MKEWSVSYCFLFLTAFQKSRVSALLHPLPPTYQTKPCPVYMYSLFLIAFVHHKNFFDKNRRLLLGEIKEKYQIF
jgi:hypothetical protein